MVRFDKGIECIFVIHTGKGLNVFWPVKSISKGAVKKLLVHQMKQRKPQIMRKTDMVGMKGEDVDNGDPTHEPKLLPNSVLVVPNSVHTLFIYKGQMLF